VGVCVQIEGYYAYGGLSTLESSGGMMTSGGVVVHCRCSFYIFLAFCSALLMTHVPILAMMVVKSFSHPNVANVRSPITRVYASGLCMCGGTRGP